MGIFFRVITFHFFLLWSVCGYGSLFGLGKSEKFKIPELTGPVVDEAQVLDASTKEKLEKFLFLAERKEKIQLQVVTLKSLEGHSIEEVSIQIVDQWKLGHKDSDKGVLFLVVPSERKARIEVGQGLEGDIPDAVAKRILADRVRPYFKAGDFSGGILVGSLEILKYGGFKLQTEKDTGYQRGDVPLEIQLIQYLIDKLGFGFFILLVIIVIFLRAIAPFGFGSGLRRGRGSWGGGGWPGGGGGFSGGGSSDSW
jgi:uncharacterized protein